ncbi:cellobiose phosphorylase [Anaerosolibacter carboniphilus]|uniref:Cellobiose phosphorylase n=2 Tax=Anaerosolibacter carboniphilus TaxID=1417629 RepID=A0A841L0Z2_9FIRM|nr:cellobiose phosphorylase [Anaerosolibacter carboniphilus]
MLSFYRRNFKRENNEYIGIKDVLLNPEELNHHAKEIAKTHNVSGKHKSTQALLYRLENNYKMIFSVYKRFNEDAKMNRDISPASEWLLDNFYKIEEQVKEVRQNLMKDKFIKLDTLSSGFLKGYPRTYGVALELISHTDGRIDEKLLIDFIEAYQSQKILSIAEIWSLSLMIRIALIENIRNICEKINQTQNEWRDAENVIARYPNEIVEAFKQGIENNNRICSSYIEHFLKKLRREGIDSGEILTYIEKKLSEYNTSVKKLIDEEHLEQAARKISIGNSIVSLHTVGTIDWNDIFETLSIVEGILRKDPSGIYPLMDFQSRDYYRNRIEKIANKYNISETKIAWKAIECAERANNIGPENKVTHVGYYLIDKGIDELMSKLGLEGVKDRFQNQPLSVYVSPIMTITILITLLFMFYAYGTSVTYRFVISLLAGIVVFIPASDIAVTIINWTLLHIFPPTFLPRLEYKEGIPADTATIIVMPTLLPNEKRVKELLEQLEVYYLSNKEDRIFFALVGDYKDAEHKELPEDQLIVRTALEAIEKLNKKYADGRDVFYFFHRDRQYCEKQNKWMGWERKRGALVEFNELISGVKNTSYTIISSDISDLKHIKYVITIDADTNLPIDTAKELIGIISHPLNKAVMDEKNGVIKEGYGLIQPRISLSLESANKSYFTRIFAGQGGVDPYTTAFSDIYQDLFGEGIFTGKGIYDIKIFQKILKDAIPDNTVLSHDLLEGSYIRAGLASDIELIDGYPSKYSSFMMRQHRWVRGDWQLIKWLTPFVHNRYNEIVRNPLSTLSKWKILDNLRRSLVSISLMVLFILGLIVLPGRAIVWVGFGIFTICFPLFMSFVDYIRLRYYKSIREKLNGNLIIGLKAAFYQAMLNLVFLPYHAYIMTDAIVRTLYRVYISKRNMLEWITAADMERTLKNDFFSCFKRMKIAVLIDVIIFFLVLWINPSNLVYVVPLVLLWLASPYVAFYVSGEVIKKVELLNELDTQLLKKIARKTWAYYEDFAGEENNFLPPDNYQVYPPNGVAHRTSPTNIGFLLMSILSARDFGYISIIQMMDKIEKTISTIERMETWKGHLFNWYDTRTLEVLRPFYISSVDSGNFVTYLIAVKEGLSEYIHNPVIDINLLQGLKDTIEMMEENDKLEIQYIDEMIGSRKISLTEWIILLETLSIGQYGRIDLNTRINEMVVNFKRENEQLFPHAEILSNAKIFVTDDEKYRELKEQFEELQGNISLAGLIKLYSNMIYEIDRLIDLVKNHEKENEYLVQLKAEIIRLKSNVGNILEQMDDLINRINQIIDTTQFIHLYDSKRNLFSIGYDVEKESLTSSYYDLLASEARATSYLAIARREIPKKHWFKLGRALSVINGYRGLVSWTGTMFEYFMPNIIMKNFENTLMDESYATVVKAQKRYGDKRNVPWGVSESGYYAFDMVLNYQYKAFGVPDLGLKRGLIDDMVVSPYSTILALPFDAKGVIENLKKLLADGLEGDYGLYEAVDYTLKRLSPGRKKEIIQSFMAHHQGMIFTALNNYLHGNVMQNRFHADPRIKVGEILLQEKVPLRVIITKEYKEQIEPLKDVDTRVEKVVRNYGIPDEIVPKCHLLSNGRYAVMVTNGGNGYSKMEDIQVTRWREDRITGKYGTYVFVHNLSTDEVWSATYEPINKEPDGYKAIFSQDKIEFLRTDENITTHTEIVVSTEDNVEIRRITLTNHGNEPVYLEITSYFETVIGSQSGDIAHPAFSNLFVRTELVPEYACLIASRRPREEHQVTKWAFHSVNVEGETVGGLQYETNRGNFIGRGRTISNPIASTQPLTNTVGIVLDPIMSLRRKIRIESGKNAVVSYIIGVANHRDEAIELAQKYRDYAAVLRTFQLAITRSEVEASYLNLKAEEIMTYQDMLSQIIYLSPLRRKNEKILMKNWKGQSGLWAYGISGDLPIVLVSIKRTEDIDIVRKLLKAHEYWRTKGLNVDLIILNEDESNYLQPLQQLIHDVVLGSNGNHMLDKPGGIFIHNANIMPEEDWILLYTAARIVLKGEGESIHKQIQLDNYQAMPLEQKEFGEKRITYISNDEPLDTKYFNGYGGFGKAGKEYIIRLKENIQTPAPWINVIGNNKFGFQVSENGSGYTWSENSRENKLTPWSNDPISDTPGEIIYITDDETGESWSVTPLPIREEGSYTIRHGLGYSVFEHNSHGIRQELTMFVPVEASVKINFIKLKNISNARRKFTITYYLRPVLGVNEQFTQQFITTEMDTSKEVILVKNSYNSDFPGRIAFVGSSEKIVSYTCDRAEFVGVNSDLTNPMALKGTCLSNTAGAGYDPCVCIQAEIEMSENEEKELLFLFGQAKEVKTVYEVVDQYKSILNCKEALESVKNYWMELLEIIQVKTPDLSMDFMLNYWLMYQTIACRVWARSAFYQSGGAYGFRDQLQDTMNAVLVFPEATKEQILRHCAHQFVEGDVQHWWHPGAGDKGIRTRFSDDLVWLPFVTAEYIYITEDYEILKEEIHFLEEEPLREHEDERYGIPRISEEKASVYDHCIRAIEKSLKFGEHRIPLMGSGDWNDGMNTVGNKGKGESVWLGWFIYSTLMKFAPICKEMNDSQRGERYLEIAEKIALAMEENAWDGAWYIRAFYDDGSPLGSSKNTECIIDSLAQSWAVISKGGRERRAKEGMKAVEQYLIKKEEGLIQLFTPPFDKSDQNPGYIKGYVPGVRENGGQYTHAATWVINAFAMMGEGDKAWELYHLINPINHTRTPIECATYKVEPYVMAADVYAVSPHVGRGGWTWYTGAAGWMYKVGLEHILGFKKHGNQLTIDPCIPKDWLEYSMKYKYIDTNYTIIVKNPNHVNSKVKYLRLDGKEVEEKQISLVNDKNQHSIEIILGDA